jgi:hypothetical protein
MSDTTQVVERDQSAVAKRLIHLFLSEINEYLPVLARSLDPCA